jgi:PAS domain S-box-containing protein
MKFTRLSYRILAVFVTVVILSLGITGWALTTLAQRIVTATITQGNQELAHRIAEEIALEVENITSVLPLLAESVTLQSMGPADVASELVRYQAHFPTIIDAYVADLDGRQIARTDGEPLENVATTYGFQVAQEGHDLLSDVYLPPDGQGPILTAFLPVERDGSVVGVLVADIDFTRVQTVIETLALTRDETAVVFAENGRVVAHSRMAELDEPPSLSDPELIQTLVHGADGVLEGYTDELGRTVVGVHAPVTELGWGVVIQTPEDKLAAEVRGLLRTMVAGVLGGVVLAVAVGWLMARQLTKPVSRLVEATEQVAAGDLSASVDVTSSDEIGRLASVFNHMVLSLREAVAERRRTEEQMRQLQEYLQLQIDHMPVGLIVWDLEFHAQTWNPSAERIFQFTSEDALGKHPYNLIVSREAQPCVDDVWRRLIENDKTTYSINENITKDGRTITCEWVNTPLKNVEGLSVGVLSMVQDITERVHTEKELEKYRKHLEELVEERTAELAVAKEQAEAADRLKSAFLASMSHELRTPLNSIIGFTGIILQGLVGPLTDEQTKQLGMVRDSARHLLNLINDVLDISKIEAGQLETSSEPFDMREAVEQVVRTLRPSAEKKNLALVCKVSPEIGQITSDRRRVEQILINLVNNAIKFTEQGEVRIDCRVSDGELETQVTDTGIGIKPEDIDILFKPFRQIETGTDRRHEGTGLGLSICERLVELLGGKIWLESEYGVGSTFTFTLPVGKKERDETEDTGH